MSELYGRHPEIVALEARVAKIEARQRAQGVHDPDCGLVDTKRSYIPCDCWLSREAT